MESLETIDEKTAEKMFQRIASSIGFDKCKIKVAVLSRIKGLVMYDLCLIKKSAGIFTYLFKEDSKTGELAYLHMAVSSFGAPTFKMFLVEILRCSMDGWHIKFINDGKRLCCRLSQV